MVIFYTLIKFALFNMSLFSNECYVNVEQMSVVDALLITFITQFQTKVHAHQIFNADKISSIL